MKNVTITLDEKTLREARRSTAAARPTVRFVS